jgi:triacylglycerol lipase
MKLADITHIVKYEDFNPLLCYWMADMSQLAYLNPKIQEDYLRSHGYSNYEFFNSNGSQAFAVTKDNTIIIAFRGSQILDSFEFSDLRKNFLINVIQDDLSQKSHEGYKKYFMYIKDDLKRYISNHQGKRIIVTGHSMGAAIAAIALLHINCSIGYMFGAPRSVGNATANENINKAFDIHLEHDIISEFPTTFSGLKHLGRRIMITSDNKISFSTSSWNRIGNFFKSFGFAILLDLHALFRRKPSNYLKNVINQHLISTYKEKIRIATRSEHGYH